MRAAALHGNTFDRFLRQPARWVWLIVFWAALVSASYWWRLHELERYAFDLARQRGALVFEMVEATRLWVSRHGGVYAPITASTPPNPYLDVPDKVISTPSGTALTKINPAYMTRQLNEQIAQDRDLRIHLTSLKPINPGNAPDVWERAALEAFESRREARVSTVDADGTAVFRYMAPLEVKKPCLSCHAKQGYREGDVRGGISVTFPASYINNIVDAHRRDYLIIHVISFGLLAALSWGALRIIRRHVLALETAHGELVESEKMASLGRMVAGFAHEVNTPLGIAVGAASQSHELAGELNRLLDQDEVAEDILRERIGVLEQASQLGLTSLRRAAGMVQGFKRTAVDQISETPRDFLLREAIDDVLFTLRNVFGHSAIEVNVDCPASLQLHGQVGALSQVLTHLLENSRVHAFADKSAGGVISLRATIQGSEVVIEFTDNGIGMSVETLARAFEPFYTTRRSAGSGGLGLFVVWSLVTRNLGGSIECVSAPDAGSRFVIRFPYYPPGESP